MRKAIQFAQDIGIRVIQLAGYDVYYQEANNETRRRFRDGLKESVEMASRAQVTLAMEIMDYPLMNSISKALGYALSPTIRGSSSTRISAICQPGITMCRWVAGRNRAYRRGSCERHQARGVFKNVPFGEGVVDFERCFETLKQSGLLRAVPD